MAWTAPMTAVANTAFTAAQFNTHVRDNLNETAPAKATTAGRIFVATGANAIAERVISSDFVSTSNGVTLTTYTDPSTPGPAVTVTTGTKALALYGCAFDSAASASLICRMSVAVSGATTIAADDQWAVIHKYIDTGIVARAGAVHLFTGLNAGSNTFTCRYRVNSSSVTVADRELVVIAL
jgi:hypothetical protein